jgi:hypothetical protein
MVPECHPVPALSPEQEATLIELARDLQGRPTDSPATLALLRDLQRIAPLLARMPADWRGTVTLEYRHGALTEIRRAVPDWQAW